MIETLVALSCGAIMLHSQYRTMISINAQDVCLYKVRFDLNKVSHHTVNSLTVYNHSSEQSCLSDAHSPPRHNIVASQRTCTTP
jgi:hypothetical protein